MRAIRWFSVVVCLVSITACQAQPTNDEAGPTGSPDPRSTTVSSSTESARPAAAPDGAFTLGPDGIGPLKLGMTKTQTEATGMVNLFVNPPDDAACLWRSTVKHPSGKGGVVFISAKLGVSAIHASGSIKTPEGIGLGSSLADVRRAYAGFTPDPETGRGYPAVPGNSNAEFRISIRNEAVNELALQLRNQDCYE